MTLWTEIVTPQFLTGYVRQSVADYELSKGTLATFLPNREVQDIVARFVVSRAGLVDVARFRAYDAEPERFGGGSGQRKTIELPALGSSVPLSEYTQLRANGITDDDVLRSAILSDAVREARRVVDAMERMRGIVLATGKATIDQDNYQSVDDFGRSAAHTVTLTTPWTTSSVSRLADLQRLDETYRDTNGEAPGAIVLSTKVFRALAAGDEFRPQLLNGVSRPATLADVNAVVEGIGLPTIIQYDRNVQVAGVKQKVLPETNLFLLPAPVDVNDWEGTELGASFWGRTLTSQSADYALAANDQPGLVVGTYRNPKPPMIAEIISDAIGLPVLANADLSLTAKVI